MATMKALRWFPDKKEVALVEVPRPVLTSDDNVIVRIVYAGVCGTDLSITKDKYPVANEVTLGHENIGIVDAVGSKVSHVTCGDKVALDCYTWCDKCKFCRRGRPNICAEFGPSNSGVKGVIGLGDRDGGFAEFCEIAAKHVCLVDNTIPLENAVLSEPISCLLNAFSQCSPLISDYQVLILGGGIAGLLMSIILHHHGVSDVTVTQRSEGRRKIIDALGLGVKVCHPDQVKQEMEMKDVDLEGFDLVVDCTGNTDAIEQAIPWMARGATLNIYGACVPSSELKFNPMQFMFKEQKILSSCLNPYVFPKAVDLVAALSTKGLNLDQLGIRMYKLEEYKKAFADLESKQITKAVFDFTMKN